MVTSPSYKNRNGHLPKESGAAAELSATSGQRLIVHNPVRGIQQFVAGKLRTVQTVAAKDANPVALWKAVKRGSVNAEVTLANLYLEGEAVPQNCEQAHMLLSAASMKGSKAADNYLKSSYAERCE
jgi:TPR repeat protein